MFGNCNLVSIDICGGWIDRSMEYANYRLTESLLNFDFVT